jgi:hypothetical protein
MKNIIFFFLGIFVPRLLAGQTVVSQTSTDVGITLPSVALLDIEPNNSAVLLELKSPTEAGSFVKSTQQTNAKWINYTSAVPSGAFRSVSVQIEYGNVPAGTLLKAHASAPSGGKGTLGVSGGTITVSSSPQRIILNIGGAATGNGANFGHGISYSLEVVNVGQLDFNTSGTVGIIYTLIDN